MTKGTSLLETASFKVFNLDLISLIESRNLKSLDCITCIVETSYTYFEFSCLTFLHTKFLYA